VLDKAIPIKGKSLGIGNAASVQGNTVDLFTPRSFETQRDETGSGVEPVALQRSSEVLPDSLTNFPSKISPIKKGS